MSAGDIIDGLLGMFMPQAVIIGILSVFAAMAASSGEWVIVVAFIPAITWILGMSYGKREVYRRIGQKS